MIKQIFIQNYALISELTVDFDFGFTTLTGETGAGKSILLGAMSLILGSRADISVINDPDKKCVVEASFIVNKNLKPIFDSIDVDFFEETTIRRELSSNGKSRAFVNDTPIGLADLRKLGLLLIDIHSQHENLELNNNRFQLRIVDAVAQNDDLLIDYAQTYKEYKNLQLELEKLKKLESQSSADLEYNQFQYRQLVDFAPEKIDQTEIENEYQILSNTADIQQNIGAVVDLIADGEQNLLSQLKQVKQTLLQTHQYFAKANDYVDRLDPLIIELKDMANEMNRDLGSIDDNPERLAELHDTLNTLYSLLKKHNASDCSDLVRVMHEYEQKVGSCGSFEEQIENLSHKLSDTEKLLTKQATEISSRRQKVAKPLAARIVELVAGLGMPNAQLIVNVEPTASFTETGLDDVCFLFSANKSYAPLSIDKIASGGEISRLMLSIKTILSEMVQLPTIIFDEIDTGVSGDIAHKMALLMGQMSKHMQVIAITHLPQIAAKGQAQYRVSKRDIKDKTYSFVERLSDQDRIAEIARMVSGENITKEAIENARSLLNMQS
ncbi:MAG: DNA repair protein RecN [Salinivirgaceae bacterium]|nr:DNA repair protein RecN [Salinivirgaceae bacterium]